MSDEDIIRVVQAHKEGKKIEIRMNSGIGDNWHVDGRPRWNFPEFDYRVAPEPRKPREWYMELREDGTFIQLFTDPRQLTRGGELVLVREVQQSES